MELSDDEPLAVDVSDAIRRGDVDRLRHLLAVHEGLANAGITTVSGPGAGRRSLLHVLTDWPGHFPNGVVVLQLLVAHGADVGARFVGHHSETPLHWAASSDDVDVLDALLDAGADIEATGAVIAGGTPIADATAFGQWSAAQRLVERGARTNLYEAAAMGLLDRIEPQFEGAAPPDAHDVTRAFWGACAGGQLATAKFLAACGADVHWRSTWNDLTPVEAARCSRDEDLEGESAHRRTDRQFNAVVEWLESVPTRGE